MNKDVLAKARALAEARRDTDYESFLDGISLDAPKDWARRHGHYIAEDRDPTRFGVKEVFCGCDIVDVRLVTSVYGLSDYEFATMDDAMDYIASCRRRIAEEKSKRNCKAQIAGKFRTTIAFPFVAHDSVGFDLAA